MISHFVSMQTAIFHSGFEVGRHTSFLFVRFVLRHTAKMFDVAPRQQSEFCQLTGRAAISDLTLNLPVMLTSTSIIIFYEY